MEWEWGGGGRGWDTRPVTRMREEEPLVCNEKQRAGFTSRTTAEWGPVPPGGEGRVAEVCVVCIVPL